MIVFHLSFEVILYSNNFEKISHKKKIKILWLFFKLITWAAAVAATAADVYKEAENDGSI